MSKRWLIGGGAALAVLVCAIWLFGGSPTSEAKAGYEDGGFAVSVEGPAGQARVMKPADFVVTASGADGRPLSGADLRVVLYMPDMFCGIFEADVVEKEPGVYEVEGLPVMKGKWVAKLTLAADGRKGTFVHPFKVA